jgi:hypothetical protein
MVTVPGFLLRRLYVKGSLRNSEAGFQFELLNKLGSGYARKMLPLTVDGAEVPLDRCSFSVDGKWFLFSEVSPERPFTLAMNKSTVIAVKDAPLSPGVHKVGMAFQVAGLGTLRFDFNDTVATA